MRSAPIAIASIVATLALRSGALPNAAPRQGPTARVVAAMGPAALRFGRSIGSPTEGRLVGGTHLEESPHVRVVPVYASGDVRWGLEPLVALIERAARDVRRSFPDAIVSVGHLSRPGGGDLDRHRSHESGRDADIAFFVRNAKGKQVFASHFVPFRADGTSSLWPGAYFDDAKNWSLVASMVADAEAHVTHVFVASPLRARLLEYAERIGASPAVRVRAAELMQQPRGTLPHDDHFHVRIGCPARMSGCVENPVARVVVRPSASATVHGRHPGSLHVATPPRRTSPSASPEPPPPASAPAVPTSPHPAVDGDEPGDLPQLPPASVPAPLDDVDG